MMAKHALICMNLILIISSEYEATLNSILPYSILSLFHPTTFSHFISPSPNFSRIRSPLYASNTCFTSSLYSTSSTTTRFANFPTTPSFLLSAILLIPSSHPRLLYLPYSLPHSLSTSTLPLI